MMDIDNLYGAFDFLEITKKYGIHPLLGLEMTVLVDEQEVNLRFLALSSVGYQQLMKLSTARCRGEKLVSLVPVPGGYRGNVPYLKSLNH